MEIQNNKKDLYQTVDSFNIQFLFALTSAFSQPNKTIVTQYIYVVDRISITSVMFILLLTLCPVSCLLHCRLEVRTLDTALLFIMKAYFLDSSRVTWVSTFGQVCMQDKL